MATTCRTHDLIRQLDQIIELGNQLNDLLAQNTRLMEEAMPERKAA